MILDTNLKIIRLEDTHLQKCFSLAGSKNLFACHPFLLDLFLSDKFSVITSENIHTLQNRILIQLIQIVLIALSYIFYTQPQHHQSLQT